MSFLGNGRSEDEKANDTRNARRRHVFYSRYAAIVSLLLPATLSTSRLRRDTLMRVRIANGVSMRLIATNSPKSTSQEAIEASDHPRFEQVRCVQTAYIRRVQARCMSYCFLSRRARKPPVDRVMVLPAMA